jgi:hypothetical protein
MFWLLLVAVAAVASPKVAAVAQAVFPILLQLL